MADLGLVGQQGLTTKRSGLYLNLAWSNTGCQQGLRTKHGALYLNLAWSNIGGRKGLTTKRTNIPVPISISMLNAYIAEIKIYNEAKDDAFIAATPGPVSSATDSSLKFHVSCLSKGVDNIVTGEVTPLAIIAPNADDIIDQDVYPPLRFGESFVVNRFTVNTTATCSIKFPLVPPADVDFALVVMWIDEQSTTQRRLLWNASSVGNNAASVSIEPWPTDYNGEPLPALFYLEVWNVDELESATLAEDFIIYLSLITQPNDSHDHSSLTDNTPAESLDIAETFPLTFPLTFDQPLTIID